MRTYPVSLAIDPLAEFMARGPQAEEMLSPSGPVLASASPAQFKTLSSSAGKLAIRPTLSVYRGMISHGGQIAPRRLQ